jgi:hypothetical protein
MPTFLKPVVGFIWLDPTLLSPKVKLRSRKLSKSLIKKVVKNSLSKKNWLRLERGKTETDLKKNCQKIGVSDSKQC